MTRASFLIAIALSAAAAAQPALPLPGAAPDLPLPGAEKKQPEAKKKDAPPPPLPLPGMAAAKKAETKAAPPPLPLPGLDASKTATAQPKPAQAKQPEAKPATATAQQKPSDAKPAIAPAARPNATPASTALTNATRPSAKPAEMPLASSALKIGDMRLRPEEDQQLWNVRGFVGGERSTEQDYTDAASLSRIGAEVTRWFSGNWIVRGEADWRSSTQNYVPLHSAANSPVRVDENRFDVLATVGYDVGPRLLDSGRLELTPMMGVGYMGIRNQAFPSDLIGPDIGGRARFALSPSVTAHATFGYTFNLAVASTQNSALKSPKGDFNARAGLSLPLSGGYALELDYSGDVIAFENTYRVAHGAALGFGTSF